MISIEEKKNGKWQILVNGESTGKEYVGRRNALYWASRLADSKGLNEVYLPSFTYHINAGGAI